MPLSDASFPRCRSHDLFYPLEEYPEALRRNPADEAYWFKGESTFNGDATIRVSRLGGEAMASCLHRTSRFGRARCRHTPLTMSDWRLLEDAVIVANFSMLEERELRLGLDGADWTIAGRRRSDYHLVKRWGPDGALWDLGRLLFDLAGLTEVRSS